MRWLVCLVVFCSLAVRWGESLNSGDACKTPLGADGLCLPVENCTHVQKILKNPDYSDYDTQYLETLKCGDVEVPGSKGLAPLMCCPQFKNTPNCGAAPWRDTWIYELDQDEHPWAALLFYDVGKNRTVPKCGGALINDRYVITAAHCIVDRPQWKLLFVRFNEFNTSITDNCTSNDYGDEICRVDYEVENFTPHPLYDMNNISRPNDIAILRLATEVTFNEYVRPICLPLNLNTEQLLVLDQYFTVTGWGKTEEGRYSDVKRDVELHGLDNDVCNTVYAVANVTLTDNQLCVGVLNGPGSCRGDSGGPLMRQIDGEWYLFGVVSFGAWFCGHYKLPVVYTNVVKYLNWMEDVMYMEEYL